MVLLLFCRAYGAGGYEQTIRTETLELRHGLSQNTITAIAQDTQGFMWFGTQDGLNRYDGYTFKVYKPDQNRPGTISNNSIWALYIDRQQILWIGTYLGLNQYNADTEQFISYLHDPENPESLSNNNVKTIYEDKKGRFWLGTHGGGLNQLNRTAGSFSHYVHNPNIPTSISNNIITSICEDTENQLWVGTHRGVNQFNPETGEFHGISNASDKLQNAIITVLFQDRSGLLWIGTDGDGIFVYDKKQDRITHYYHQPETQGALSGNKVISIYEDSKGRLLIGTLYNGLNRFDRDSNRFIHYKDLNDKDPHSDKGFYSIYEDTAGVLWLGTYTTGLQKLNPYDFSQSLVHNISTAQYQYTQNDARAFLLDRDGVLWVGSESSGIRKTHPDGRIVTYLHNKSDKHSLASNSVFSIIQDRSGVIWIGTTEGWLHRYQPRTNNFIRYSSQTASEAGIHHDRVRRIMEDHQGILWVGVDGGGLHRFDKKTGEFTHYHSDSNDPYSLSHNRVFSLLEDRLHQFWIATFGGGLNKFDRNSGKFIHFKHDKEDTNSISYDYIICITEDQKKNALWLGTDGEGFEYFDTRSEIFTHYDEEIGLPNTTIYGILQDSSDALWMTHNKGLSHYNPATGVIRNYDERDGLQSNEFNGGSYYRSFDGELYFGGINGYNHFYPHDITDNPHRPPVVITGFQLFSKDVEIGKHYNDRLLLPRSISVLDTLTLSYKDYIFSFEFAALDYVLPSKNQYFYKMEGLEDHWNQAGNRRFATYTTLPPGKYQFRVKASNSHGIMNEIGTTLEIYITPPFWQTWWFRTAGGLLLMLLIFTAYALRVKSIQARNRLLEQEVQTRTAELENQKNHLENTLAELQETKDALVEAAHKAGMADSATHVLHNIGNLLNSVTTCVGLIRTTLTKSALGNLLRANTLLRTHIDNLEGFINRDPKGKKLMHYYLEIEKPMHDENTELLKNTERLSERVRAIADAIASQHEYVKDKSRHRFAENLSVEKIINECLLTLQNIFKDKGIAIKTIFQPDIGEIHAHKSKVAKVVINLLKNATESIARFNGSSKTITIVTEKNEESIYIKILDTGIGIEKNQLTNIFAYGSSKKGNGHGHSLHSSANFMTEMNGKLWAESEGIGSGACFILKFPHASQKSH